jgi:hypothetical protein
MYSLLVRILKTYFNTHLIGRVPHFALPYDMYDATDLNGYCITAIVNDNHLSDICKTLDNNVATLTDKTAFCTALSTLYNPVLKSGDMVSMVSVLGFLAASIAHSRMSSCEALRWLIILARHCPKFSVATTSSHTLNEAFSQLKDVFLLIEDTNSQLQTICCRTTVNTTLA